jgi:hypothetical protein
VTERRPGRLEARWLARARQRQRLQRMLVTVLLLAAVGLAGIELARADPQRDAPPGGRAALGAAPGALAAASGLADGAGTWRYAESTGDVSGAGGDVLRFRVAVEEGVPVEVAAFAGDVDGILGAERGWTAGGEHRFRRVVPDGAFDATIYLATPATSEDMCATGGVHTGGRTSCHLPSQVIINAAQWLAGAPGAAAPLEGYQAYLLNHLMGRELGYGLEACPRPGQPAPVMLPQSVPLRGCTLTAWPYRGTVRYAGPPIP